MKKIFLTSLLTFGLLLTGLFGMNHKAEASTIGLKAIETAKKNLGSRYIGGGISPSTGFDCSGLVGYSYKQAGKSLPRVAADMYKVGKAVSKNQLQKGDLVFFNTGGSGVSHVGIYIGGNQFIHSQYTYGVSITSLSDPYYWGSKYYGAKRVN